MRSYEYYMKRALEEAEIAYEKDEVPVGAVIVCRDRIIARAHNLSERLNDPTAHAEMQAFTAATDQLENKLLDKCILFVTIEPCVMCAGAAFWTRIGRIVYGAKDPKRGYTLIDNEIVHPKCVVENGIMEKECGELLSAFFKEKRKKK